MPPVNFKITRGLSLFDCQDHHAILGVPLNAEAKVIRKRYLKIARRLHPDSVGMDIDKEAASTLLSKLINPSYEFLSQPSHMDEYNILLKLVGQRYAQEQHRFKISCPEAQELMASTEIENAYLNAIESLATQQFSSLDHYQEITGNLSEINLVYLYRQEGGAIPVRGGGQSSSSQPSPSRQSPGTSSGVSQPRSTQSTVPASSVSPNRQTIKTTESGASVNHDLVNQYCRRAEELIAKACYLEAIRELKEVVEGNNPIDPNNARVYTLLGNIYKDHMKQPIMAKPFYMRALRADPQNTQAQQMLAEITPASSKKPNSQASGKTAAEPDKKKFGFLNFLSRKK